jgi:aspartyl aminopeptidase
MAMALQTPAIQIWYLWRLSLRIDKMNTKTAKKLLKFIQKSPTAFQAVEEMKKRLEKEGYKELKEEEHWEIIPGGNYYVTRNNSALIAFSIPKKPVWKFHIMASHSDSPALKIKENPEIEVEKAYIKLNVERYGGMLLAPWFDRPLSVAGRLIVRKDGEIQEKLVTVDKDLLIIPNLAIHMNREVNDGYKYNVQKDMLPLYSSYEGKGSFMKQVAAEAGVEEKDILGHDLFLYDRTAGTIWGADEEFVSAPRLDDIQCAFASFEGFLRGEHKKSIAVHCVLDNEEVGLGRTEEEYLMALADSFMVSADNAHALHPNHTDKTDPVNRPVINGGIVIKYNANQKYCTDGVSAAIFKDICDKAGVPYQTFVNRSDMAGGSTLGNISNTQVPMKTVDIGLAQLAMHSVYETAGVKDTENLAKAAAELFA